MNPEEPDADEVEVVFEQTRARHRTENVPLSHLSIEVGHLYMAEQQTDLDALRLHFADIAHWVGAAVSHARERSQELVAADGEQPDRRRRQELRVSTCYLVDDYSRAPGPPAVVMPLLLQAAREHDIQVDYLARESAFAEVEGIDLARILEARLVTDPPPGTTGARPPVTAVGWLANGQRSPATERTEAMAPYPRWVPPNQNAADRHSVFLDVELWDERDGRRTWSCAFMATVWQLLRLGLLRSGGRAVVKPQVWEGAWPRSWRELPPLLRLTENPAPFSAYRALSIIDNKFLPIEHSVRTILDQVAIDGVVAEQIADRARSEGVVLPPEAADRLQYVFL